MEFIPTNKKSAVEPAELAEIDLGYKHYEGTQPKPSTRQGLISYSAMALYKKKMENGSLHSIESLRIHIAEKLEKTDYTALFGRIVEEAKSMASEKITVYSNFAPFAVVMAEVANNFLKTGVARLATSATSSSSLDDETC